jgi:hypothetical protein
MPLSTDQGISFYAFTVIISDKAFVNLKEPVNAKTEGRAGFTSLNLFQRNKRNGEHRQ